MIQVFRFVIVNLLGCCFQYKAWCMKSYDHALSTLDGMNFKYYNCYLPVKKESGKNIFTFSYLLQPIGQKFVKLKSSTRKPSQHFTIVYGKHQIACSAFEI